VRDDFDAKTKEILARRVGYCCSNPDCGKPTSGPQEDPAKALNIGVAAHITAASEGGPRYDPSLLSEECGAVGNGIWLCQNCAKLIDSDVLRYTVESLREWKERAEEAALRGVEGGAVPLLSPSPEAIARHRAALRENLEAEARVRWGGMSLYIQEQGATLPIEASPYQTGRLGPRENFLQLLHTAKRLLVLGEPGSGKTVSLERLAWELCGGPEPTVPVVVRLFRCARAGWDGAEQCDH